MGFDNNLFNVSCAKNKTQTNYFFECVTRARQTTHSSHRHLLLCKIQNGWHHLLQLHRKCIPRTFKKWIRQIFEFRWYLFSIVAQQINPRELANVWHNRSRYHYIIFIGKCLSNNCFVYWIHLCVHKMFYCILKMLTYWNCNKLQQSRTIALTKLMNKINSL